MNAAVNSALQVQTSEYEDAAFKEMFPWRCYRNGMKTSHDFKTVGDVSNATGISVEEIEYAIEHHEGNMGGFIFVKH